jgi:uncharacterized paraquat-inducible protein A
MRVESRVKGQYYLKTTVITHDCKCNEYKALKRNYMNGQKACKKCDVFMVYDGNFCPCCRNKLRTKRRGVVREGVPRI